VLPHLKTQTPKELIEALRQGLDTFAGEEEEGRDKSLTISLDYSFSKLSEKARRHLPFLGLFSEKVDAHWLYVFSKNPDDEDGQAYQAVFGENLQKDDWLAILNEAAAASIVQQLDSTIYKIHPALPWFLRKRLNTAASLQSQASEKSGDRSPLMTGEEVISELEKKLLIFYAYLADNCNQALIDNAEFAVPILQFEEPNLLQSLRIAEQQQEWAIVQAILQPLGEIYERIGRKAEFQSLRLEVLKQIGINLTIAKAKGKEAFALWMYLRNKDGNTAALRGSFEEAKKIYQNILDELIALNDPSVNEQIAISYNLLGNIEWEKSQFDEAIGYYQKALKIFEESENYYRAAFIYFQIGNVALGKKSFEKAILYYQKSLNIFEDIGDLYKVVNIYNNLGLVAKEQQKFDNAITFFVKAIQIYKEIGDEYSSAASYHNLGVIAEQQGKLEDAMNFYYKSLQIKESTENYYRAASDYHNLGNVALKQQKFDDAIAYSQKALQVYEAAGDKYNMTDVYFQLGRALHEQQQFDKAIEYYKKAFLDYQNFQEWYKASITLVQWGNALEIQEKWKEALQIYTHFIIDSEHIQELMDLRIEAWARILKQLGENQFDKIWYEAMGEECPGELREDIWAARDRLDEEG
jgi:tetratricopeptide (TPR) repeat protein